jgi:hypothetical protein
MAVNLSGKFGTGLAPQQFVDGMTKNQDKFEDWYRRFEWVPEDKAFFQSLQGKGPRCLILAADWCGDVVRNVPVIFHAMHTAGIHTEVLVMEDNLDVMDQFLTMGGRSIPVVLFVNDSGDVLGQWGPRPHYVQEPMVNFKRENPDSKAPDYDVNLKAAREEIMKRYGEDTAYQTLIVKELRQVLASVVR